ncbi:MAG: zinc transport system substrate-binding protein [Sulfurimonas sp.]|uniref:metal ABC transporter substrate-binding protein n=1 Tax=Sulfurimonas sp. TaxID=2022749 RepID=UPI0039E38BFC
MKKSSIRTLTLIISTFMVSFFFLGCNETQKTKNPKTIVSLSSFALYDIAKNIAGDTIELVNIVPFGVGIHSYEPTPKIMAKIEQSNLVLYNGAGLEPWLSSFDFKNRAVGMGDYIPLRKLSKDEDHKEHSHDGHACSHTVLDPHIWFDIQNMKRMTNIITYEFISLKPENKDLYLLNRDRYIDMLSQLEKLHQSKLQSCKLDTIITDHNAFSYLSKKYGFHVKTLSGFSPDVEVSPKDIIRVMNDIKKYNLSVVFFENFGSDKSMKSLASESNVTIDSLHPLGNITKNDADLKRTYEDIMKENLEKISKALICQ